MKKELARHADRIESGELVWKPEFPEEPGACCAAFWIEPDAEPREMALGDIPLYPVSSLTDAAGDALVEAIDWIDFDHDLTYEPSTFEMIGDWNDRPKERTREQVIETLRRASRGSNSGDA